MWDSLTVEEAEETQEASSSFEFISVVITQPRHSPGRGRIIAALSLSHVLDPIQRQIAEISKGNSEASSSNDVNVDIQDLREKQQILDIETKAATMKTAGAQSQYRIMASVKKRITNSIAQLEEIRLTCEFEDVYLKT